MKNYKKTIQAIGISNLYNNQLNQQKDLKELIKILGKEKQFLVYDFQKKVYTLYPEANNLFFHNFIRLEHVFNLSLLCLLTRYLKDKNLPLYVYTFLKLHFITLSKLITLRLSVLFFLLEKRFRYLRRKNHRLHNSLKQFLFVSYKKIIFKYWFLKSLAIEEFSEKNIKNQKNKFNPIITNL